MLAQDCKRSCKQSLWGASGPKPAVLYDVQYLWRSSEAEQPSSPPMLQALAICVFDVRAVFQLMRGNFDVDFLSTSEDRTRRMTVSGERKEASTVTRSACDSPIDFCN
jgi:hypothetical protein